jgi:ABC-type multidrug transport system fused ATPase/permease subunit
MITDFEFKKNNNEEQFILNHATLQNYLKLQKNMVDIPVFLSMHFAIFSWFSIGVISFIINCFSQNSGLTILQNTFMSLLVGATPPVFIVASLVYTFHNKFIKFVPHLNKQKNIYLTLQEKIINTIQNPQFQDDTLCAIINYREKIVLSTNNETQLAQTKFYQHYKNIKQSFTNDKYTITLKLLMKLYSDINKYNTKIEDMKDELEFNQQHSHLTTTGEVKYAFQDRL